MGMRLLNALLGSWLYLSAFLWPHAPFERTNAWVSGMIAVTAALVGLGKRKAGRYVNAVLGAWLIVSAIFTPTRAATFWNHLLVGFALALFALAPSLSALRERRSDI
jgi:hypothetical protein